MAAHHLDHLHEQLTSAAQNAASTLARVASGTTSINSLGVLKNSTTQIDILAARRADAVVGTPGYQNVRKDESGSCGAVRPALEHVGLPIVRGPATHR